MKGVVGFMFFMLFLAGFAFVMLQGRHTAGGSIAGIEWRPVTVGGASVPADSGMTVRFAADGGINGNGGCNGFFGKLEKTESGFSVGPLGSTRRACEQAIMDRESAFLDALQNTRDIVRTEQSLRLEDENGSTLAELVQSAEPEAADPR